MTEGRLSGANFESLIDRQIREAQERGAFDDLPGSGKPIPDLDQPHDEMWWIKDKMRREKVSYTPPTLILRKEVDDIHDAAAAERTEAAVRALVADLNARILEAIRRPMSGPPLNLQAIDVEPVVREWHRRR